MRTGLELNITQKHTLSLTPQLLQAIQILAMSRTELEEHIASELESNPALEAAWDGGEDGYEATERAERQDERAAPDRFAEDFDWAGYLNEKGYDDSGYAASGYGGAADEAAGIADPRGSGQTLAEFLLEQLTPEDLRRVSPDIVKAYELLEFIAESLDENGFLTQTAEETAAEAGVSAFEAEAAILVLRGMEPVGVASAGVREALAAQYERAGGTDPLVTELILTRLADVAARSAAAVSRSIGRKREDVERAFEIIAALDPKPARGFRGGSEAQYIIPDIVIVKTEDGYEAQVNNDRLPSLTVSPSCRKILETSAKDSEAYQFLTGRLNAATSLIKSIERRRQTIYNTMNVILSKQRAFLDNGQEFLKPMTLRQVADELGLHESTVSRAVRNKYVLTPRGAVEMRRFFSAGVKTSDGAGAASRGVQAKIAALIGGEDKRAPLSDRALVEKLQDDGIFLSRRTVAKYRGETGLPSSAKRTKR